MNRGRRYLYMASLYFSQPSCNKFTYNLVINKFSGAFFYTVYEAHQ